MFEIEILGKDFKTVIASFCISMLHGIMVFLLPVHFSSLSDTLLTNAQSAKI